MRNKIILAFLIILLVCNTVGYSQEVDLNLKYRECQSNANCIIIPTYCGGWATVNKKYKKEELLRYKALGATQSCQNIKIVKPDAQCINNICEPIDVRHETVK